MKKIYSICFIIISITVSGCLRVTDYEAMEGQIPLVDSSLVTPAFNSASYSPASGAFDFSVSKSTSDIYIFYTAGSNIYALSVTGTVFGTEVLVRNNTYTTSTIDAAYDATYNRFRIVHSYDAGGWPPNGLVMGSSWNEGSTNTFNIDDMAADKVSIVEAGGNFYQFSVYVPAERMYYKTIDFSGIASQSINPAFSFGDLNSTLFHNFSSDLEDIDELRSTTNPNTGDAMIGMNWTGSGTNTFYTIKSDGDINGGNNIYKATGTAANKFACAPLGNNFLMAYESNRNIEQQNNGYYELTGEHIRMTLMSGDGENVNLGLGGANNPSYIETENSIALPQSNSGSNLITSVALAANTDASEVGLSFIRDNNLYFTKVLIQSGKLRISPISTVDTGISASTVRMRAVFFGGKYYIINLIMGTFTVYESV